MTRRGAGLLAVAAFLFVIAAIIGIAGGSDLNTVVFLIGVVCALGAVVALLVGLVLIAWGLLAPRRPGADQTS